MTFTKQASADDPLAMDVPEFRAKVAAYAHGLGASCLRWRKRIESTNRTWYDLLFVGLSPALSTRVQIQVARMVMEHGARVRSGKMMILCGSEPELREGIGDVAFELSVRVCRSCGGSLEVCARCAPRSRTGGAYCPTCDVDRCEDNQTGLFHTSREGVMGLVVHGRFVADFDPAHILRFYNVTRTPILLH